jgi:UDP-glucose:(heptosyl)LPS alpha-1,3-glucosyltransferase
MEIIQVVKRFGTCGGMEEYVFRITEELTKLGIRVTVLCEIQLTRSLDGVNVVQLGEGIKKPRWVSHFIFSKKVSSWVKRYSNRNQIIHSHERISCHHITTIHSTLFNFPKKGFPSFRKCMNEYLEKREISCDSLKKIVPVSHLIADEVTAKYNPLCSRLSDPVSPGVCEIVVKRKKFNSEKPVIGFMGKEWKRKGLPKVIEIWREIRKKMPGVELCLAGFSTSIELGLSESELNSVQVLGYVKGKSTFFSKIDILLHPASKEAYGMVIAEATSIGIPVVVSGECGAVDDINVKPKKVHRLDDAVSEWASSILDLLTFCSAKNSLYKPRSWGMCAENYKKIYDNLK